MGKRIRKEANIGWNQRNISRTLQGLPNNIGDWIKDNIKHGGDRKSKSHDVTLIPTLEDAGIGKLSLAKDLPEIKQIKDIAKATLAYVKAKGMSKGLQDDAGMLVIEAGIKFSEMKKAGQKAGLIRTSSTGSPRVSLKKKLTDFGVKKQESYVNDQLAKDEEITSEIIEDLEKQDIRITESAVVREIRIKKNEDNREIVEWVKVEALQLLRRVVKRIYQRALQNFKVLLSKSLQTIKIKMSLIKSEFILKLR